MRALPSPDLLWVKELVLFHHFHSTKEVPQVSHHGETASLL